MNATAIARKYRNGWRISRVEDGAICSIFVFVKSTDLLMIVYGKSLCAAGINMLSDQHMIFTMCGDYVTCDVLGRTVLINPLDFGISKI